MPKPTILRGRLEGKVAIVTGAGADGDDVGIGRAIAWLLAAEGAKVACIDLVLQRAEVTIGQIKEIGGSAFAFAGDVTDPDVCARIVEQTVASFGGVDILVNNVGSAQPMELLSVELKEWHRLFDINLTSAMLMSKYSIPEMVKTGGGSIIHISSLAGLRATGSLGYGPSKAAMHQLSREIGVQHGRGGIRSNSVAPGHMATPFALSRLPAEMREARRKIAPLPLEGDAWDVAQAVLFLASDEARFINGVHLAVDGGVAGIAPLTAAEFLNG